MSSARNLLTSFLKTRRADRFLPHNYTGTYESFERLYSRARDPWGLQYSPLATQRYLSLIEIISQVAPCTAILDVGCGEGVFTKYLTGFAREVVGIDVSPTAIERAKKCVPRASFHCVALEDFHAERRFDLVVAVEMLYYVESVGAALEKLQALGKTLIVTYAHQRKRIDSHLDRFGDQSSRRFYSFWGAKGFTVARLSSRSEEEPNGTFDSRGITDLH